MRARVEIVTYEARWLVSTHSRTANPMARPITIRDQAIVDAAREVFLSRGLEATTAEVAARAGISEGSIFKRFRTKFDLFRAAMEPQLEEPRWLSELAARVGGPMPVRESLFLAGVGAIGFFRQLMPLVMMSWSHQSSCGLPEALRGDDAPPMRVMRELRNVFAAEMDAGRLRRADPEVAARMFLGALHQHVFFSLLVEQQHQVPPPPEPFVREAVSLLMEGLDQPSSR